LEDVVMDYKKWYWARFEDSETWWGGVPTREDAILEGRSDCDDDEGFYICEASNPPVTLADWIGDGDDLIDKAHDSLFDSDRISYEHDDRDIFTATPEQVADLTTRIRAACNEWQAAHGLVFTVRSFEDMSVPEYVPPLEPPQ
jgi:hypothetical protein